ncbi:MAG: hypothetical protein L6R28_12575 [Planctomycetes bacterium]|nr:hypothetical protein [Planctomycetota bacterium]
MHPVRILFLALALSALAPARSAAQDAYDEFRIRRAEVFEFAEAPAVTRNGDRVQVVFAAKAACDVTVAVENSDGKIIRHLASGVLGSNAPPPFEKDSLRQSVVWDGKDDSGKYVDDKDSHSIRVSLGLKPQFERTLFWSPHKRVSSPIPLFCAAPEGMYVFENYALDHNQYGGSMVKLFDHDGKYVRTVYPFPSAKVGQVAGLPMHEFTRLGKTLPLKEGYYQSTLLDTEFKNDGGGGPLPTAFAVQGSRVAVAFERLNRFATDGSSGGVKLHGPVVGFQEKLRYALPGKTHVWGRPRSAAFSPDGKYLYMAGYLWNANEAYYHDWLHGVARVEFDKDAEPETFCGSLKQDETGAEPGKFTAATSLDVDAQGRVYVTDYHNNRIQVFTPDGKLYKVIPIDRPVFVQVHKTSGEIYVFSWLLVSRWNKQEGTKPFYTRLGPVDDPKVLCKCPLPLVGHSEAFAWNNLSGLQFNLALDSWAKEPTIWLLNGSAQHAHSGNGSTVDAWDKAGVVLLVEKGKKLEQRLSFTKQAADDVVRIQPQGQWRQRLYVNPANGHVYIAEGDSGVNKSVNQLVEINPENGKTKLLDLPLGSEDLCFGNDGLAYLRSDTYVGRYDARTWREVPWDYGQEEEGHSFGMGARAASFVAGLKTPGHRSHNFWHLGGIDVSLKGHLVVTTCNGKAGEDMHMEEGRNNFKYEGKPYLPRLYPGRNKWGEIHIWDRHGTLVVEDAVPGLGHLNGIGIDDDDNLYLLAAKKRTIDGKGYDPTLKEDWSGTLLKVAAGKNKVLTAGPAGAAMPVPLPDGSQPKRPTEMRGQWVEGLQWIYGGVGFCTPKGCICVNTRFDLDYFNRSFAPEQVAYRVAVLDGNGNLVLRLGDYGNVDDGKPLAAEGGPPAASSIGGDEVALFHACFVASHTDRRLFIADQGNARLLSVKLGYHAEKTIPLKDVPEK